MQVEAWLSRAAGLAPKRTALETPQGTLDYSELLLAARLGARQLAKRGARRGERVAIALPPGLGFAQALHACMLLGAVAVPVDPRLTTQEREQVCAGASVLVDRPLEGESDALPAAPATHELEDVCAVIHTSGTTSAPKPVALTYGNFLWSALGSGVALGVRERDRWLCALPLSHVGGLSILLRSAIYATTAVVHERFDSRQVVIALQEQRITLVSLVATTLARLLDAGLHEPPWLRCALTGGGPVPEALVERAHQAGVPVLSTYGLTEACSQVTTGGPPLFCTRVRLAADGEILVAGPTIAPRSLAADGFLHTGDLGEIDGAGELRLRGRKADTIISGGENVAPSEVEAVLEAHTTVREAAVLAREDPEWGEAVTAILVLADDATLDEPAVRAHCAARLAPYKVPKRFEISPDPLPRTRSGKLLRREL